MFSKFTIGCNNKFGKLLNRSTSNLSLHWKIISKLKIKTEWCGFQKYILIHSNASQNNSINIKNATKQKTFFCDSLNVI